jgi:hypothetical protein
VTTPGVWADELGGFSGINLLGQSLIKDVALLAAAVWSFGEAVRATRLTSIPQLATRGTRYISRLAGIPPNV